ncbi:hypothetical protein HanIR_Chr01g0011651 [Helianthus annuus]|nr:hypothetical protein HanIR_Chr02g0088791 [Helianthus annuus]KAJ0621697.1 hypothetical protein HanIR_Chr01g0011651 [Helianthus annuus]
MVSFVFRCFQPVVRFSCLFCRRSCSGRSVDLVCSCHLEFLDPWLCAEMRNVGTRSDRVFWVKECFVDCSLRSKSVLMVLDIKSQG